MPIHEKEPENPLCPHCQYECHTHELQIHEGQLMCAHCRSELGIGYEAAASKTTEPKNDVLCRRLLREFLQKRGTTTLKMYI